MDAHDEALLAELPKKVGKRMRKALVALEACTVPDEPSIAVDAYAGLKIEQSPGKARDSDALFAKAFSAAKYPEFDEVLPVAAKLDPVHEKLARLVAHRTGIALHEWAIPQTAWARRRWLGIDPPGVLDREVEYTRKEKVRRAPLWRALAKLGDEAGEKLFAALPAMDRLEALVDLALEAYRVEAPSWDDWEKVRIDEPARLSALADRVTALYAEGAPSSERDGHSTLPWPIGWLLFLSLVRAGVPIEERWDWMLPIGPLTAECVAAIAEPRQGQAIVNALKAEFPSRALASGLELAKQFPSQVLADHLMELADGAVHSLACPARRGYLADLAAAVGPELGAHVQKRLAALPPLPALRTERSLYARSVDELTAGQRLQFAVLGQGWETDAGPMVTVAEDGAEPVFGPIEFVSAFEIVDAEGAPAYEALLYMDEDGAVCEAGTTRSVMYVSQENLSWNVPDDVAEALHGLLQVAPKPRKKAAPKKAAAKKPTAKKAPPKKAPVRKTAKKPARTRRTV